MSSSLVVVAVLAVLVFYEDLANNEHYSTIQIISEHPESFLDFLYNGLMFVFF